MRRGGSSETQRPPAEYLRSILEGPRTHDVPPERAMRLQTQPLRMMGHATRGPIPEPDANRKR